MLSVALLSTKTLDTIWLLKLAMTYNGWKWLQALSIGITKVMYAPLPPNVFEIIGYSNSLEAMPSAFSLLIKSLSIT